jgi:hypothetical protein
MIQMAATSQLSLSLGLSLVSLSTPWIFRVSVGFDKSFLRLSLYLQRTPSYRTSSLGILLDNSRLCQPPQIFPEALNLVVSFALGPLSLLARFDHFKLLPSDLYLVSLSLKLALFPTFLSHKLALNLCITPTDMFAIRREIILAAQAITNAAKRRGQTDIVIGGAAAVLNHKHRVTKV